MLVPFGPMEAPHHSAARKGSSSISDVALGGWSLELPWNRLTTEAIRAEENAHHLTLPSSSKALCVKDTFTFVHVCLLPGTDESFQDTLPHRKI